MESITGIALNTLSINVATQTGKVYIYVAGQESWFAKDERWGYIEHRERGPALVTDWVRIWYDRGKYNQDRR